MISAATPIRLHPFDLALVAIYLIAITLFGLHFRPRKGANKGSSLRSYFLADNTIPWWAIALSIVSAETSTLTIISIPGVAFAGDFSFLQLVFGYMVGRIVVAMLFLPRYFSGSMLTAYQLIDRRFGATLHKVTAGLFLLTRAAAEGVRVFAISIVVGIAIGTGDVLSIAIISGLTLLYTFEGGMAAVIWTDVAQMALYIAGTFAAVYTLGTHTPGGWTQIHTVAAAAGKLHLFNFALNLTQSYTFWAGLIGGTFLTMASHGTDQLMVQRMLAARNLRSARLALLSSGAVILLQFTLFLLIGAGLYVFYGHAAPTASPDRLFPTFIVRQMPNGISGLLIAAILAAAMSNLSAALNSLSSTTVVDFYMHWRPGADDRERTLVSRSSTVLWALVLFAIAVYSIQVGGKGHVVEAGLSIASVAYGALLGVFLLGTLTRFVTQTGAILGMVCGFALNVLLWLQPAAITLTTFHFDISRAAGLGPNPLFTLPQTLPLILPKIAFTWYVPIGAAMTFLVGSIASLIFRKQSRVAVATTAFLLLSAQVLRAQDAGTHAQVPHLRPSLTAPSVGTGQSSTALSPPVAGIYDFHEVDTLINTAVVSHKLPGAVVVLGHGGTVVYKHAYGSRALEPGVEPMTEDTLFDMASLTKVLVTTTAILQLYESHKLDLDAPVARYLPEFTASGKDKITVRELLTHYSGLPEDVNLKDDWGLTTPDKAEGIRRAMAAVPYGPPGITFKYSDINFITLGALVEQVSGQRLDDYAREHIFTPFGMTSTDYHPYDRTCGPATRFGAAIEPGPKPIGRIGMVCRSDTWSPYALAPHTAPTAHDDQGTAAANPDFDHILRGTVHDPTTRRMGGVAGHAGVFSNADDAARFAQALLDKLLRNSGPFPLSQATLKLATSPNEPATAHSDATIFKQSGETTKGVASRGLGWDLNSAFSRPRGTIFPVTVTGRPGSFGHTGFTGTSIWIDPTTDSYVILLANAIHPRGAPPISTLRGEVATAAARAIASAGGASAALEHHRTFIAPAGTVQAATGIDVLESAELGPLATHKRIGLLTNQTGVDRKGHRTADVLAATGKLTTIFTPEHGLSGALDQASIAGGVDAQTHTPIRSLYGPHDADRRPGHADLAPLDAVVIDLQDAGVRFYTYETVLGYFLEAAAAEQRQGHDLEIIVLDRPAILGGTQVQGPISDAGRESYTDSMPLPVRHGLTYGELARYMNGERHLGAHLNVVPMQDWTRSEYYDDTGLAWINPSPNLRNIDAATLYPGVELLQFTNVSVGRGTASPFEQTGAPYIDARQLAAYLTARKIPGIAISPSTRTVSEDTNHSPYHGQTIPSLNFRLTDRNLFDSVEFGIELAAALHHLYPEKFNLARVDTLLANAATLHALEAGTDPREIAASWKPSLDRFREQRKPYLLYPER